MEDLAAAVGEFDDLDGRSGGDGPAMDLDTFWHILEGKPDRFKSNQEDQLIRTLSQSHSVHDPIQLQSGFQASGELSSSMIKPVALQRDYFKQTSEAFDARVVHAVGSSCIGKLDSYVQNCSPIPIISASIEDCFSQAEETSYRSKFEVSQLEMPCCGTSSSLANCFESYAVDHRDYTNSDIAEDGTRIDLKHGEIKHDSRNGQRDSVLENTKVNVDAFGDIIECCSENLKTFGSRVDGAFSVDCSMHCVPTNFEFQNGPSSEVNIKSEMDEFQSESAYTSSRATLKAQDGSNHSPILKVLANDICYGKSHSFKHESSYHVSPESRKSSYNAVHGLFDAQSQRSKQLFDCTQYCLSSQKLACVKDEQGGELGTSSNMSEAGNLARTDEQAFSFFEHKKQSPASMLPLMLHENIVNCGNDEENVVCTSKRAGVYRDSADHNASSPSSFIGGSLDVSSLEHCYPSSQSVTSGLMGPHCVEEEKRNGELILSMDTSKGTLELVHSNSEDCRSGSRVDNEPDICIIEGTGQPIPSSQSPFLGKEAANLQHSKFNHRHHHRVGSMNLRPNNERLFRRVATQDFSQPKSEATPPDGVLSVPLLRHQRIALSWMVGQETASLYCSGGILADDQGLGKTVSTIALILTERPSVRTCAKDIQKVALETLNLDDDEVNDDDKVDGDPQMGGIKQESDKNQVNESSIQRPCSLGQAKGRPAAGTLIVCPTSVLRQWAEELGNKVASKANLSVLVYHGRSRTKDPDELAKYDVVLTTYSIVSMEVPKQPSADEDGDEKERSEGDESPMGLVSSKKRKYLLCSKKRRAEVKKGVDSLLLESVSRPLAKVAWFRVVLDEAQSIKNHRTQVARACWGLRAKRRWCLSGTPIQNTIDDLYSYFRFLRCDRYATYKEFCSRIKNEISRNPSKGYLRLRAILKLIMLRRTKGTLLDGQPIITLPPKVVELKKVEFSKEERDFYSRLESESCAQFKEYAAAGTVKQNYVNLLLMLLRLRQACDHPALVNGSESNSLFSSSVLTAKKLPREKKICLLRCLEACLALCRICSDPPEDAVVAVCGHVFCNQCIFEHLTGDDKQCPAVNCKVRLSLSSVFSKATLEGALSEHPVRDSSPDCAVSVAGEMIGSYSSAKSYDSAKIREALRVLQCVAKPQQQTSADGGCCENSTHLQSGGHNGSSDKQKMGTCETLNDSVKVIGEKALVFSQWTRMLDLFEVGLRSCSIQYRRLDGTMSVAARDRALKDFNTLPEVSVMIMSLKAASLGLNMVVACHVLLLDLWWNPTTEDQAIDRAHRIGQTRPVTVWRLTVKDTIEDRILALQKKKRKMVASAFGEDETGSRQSRLTVEDFQFLFNA